MRDGMECWSAVRGSTNQRDLGTCLVDRKLFPLIEGVNSSCALLFAPF